MKSFFIIVGVFALLFMAYSCERWKYNECRAIGHGKMWCIFAEGSK